MSARPTTAVAIGIDVGTQGVRCLAATAAGEVVAHASRRFSSVALPNLPEGWFEQEPETWWQGVRTCLTEVRGALDRALPGGWMAAGVAVDSTSGTVVLADAAGRPIRPAVMYNDRRASAEADEANAAAGEWLDEAGCRFNSSFALPRLLWLRRNEPAAWDRAALVMHAADWVVARLGGEPGVTDQSNALKTGCDLRSLTWPDFIVSVLGIEERRLPRIALSGDVIGRVTEQAARQTGLPAGTPIAAGMTDGCADQVSSGASREGDWNTVLGSTLVLKGMTLDLLRDPLGRVYCHRHPMGLWMPGGASNAGARVLDARFAGADRAALEAAAEALAPTGARVYPLLSPGERFPFVCAAAAGFEEACGPGEPARYAAYLEGIAYTERLAYEVVEGLGAPVREPIYSTGGGSSSDVWTRIRASVLGRSLCRAPGACAALGSAIVAASRTLFADLGQATAAMAGAGEPVSPDRALAARFDDAYDLWLQTLRRRSWLT